MLATKELMTSEEAMAYLRISSKTFYKWRAKGEIMPENQNDTLERQPSPMFRKSDLDAFVAKRRAERTAQPPRES